MTDIRRSGELSGPRRIAALARLLLATVALPQAVPIHPPASAMMVRAAPLLDVRSGAYVRDAAIYVDGERIKAVGPAVEVLKQAPPSAATIDLGDRTVLPGLIDCHTHLLARIPEGPEGYPLNLLTKSQAYRWSSPRFGRT